MNHVEEEKKHNRVYSYNCYWHVYEDTPHWIVTLSSLGDSLNKKCGWTSTQPTGVCALLFDLLRSKGFVTTFGPFDWRHGFGSSSWKEKYQDEDLSCLECFHVDSEGKIIENMIPKQKDEKAKSRDYFLRLHPAEVFFVHPQLVRRTLTGISFGWRKKAKNIEVEEEEEKEEEEEEEEE